VIVPARSACYLGAEMTERPPEDLIGRMTPEQKLRAAERLYWSARALKAAALRARHPEWSEAEVQAAVRDAFLFHRE
jgi:hypothetical protein